MSSEPVDFKTLAIEPLAKRHDRNSFLSGSASLDEYLRNRASQDARNKIAVPFVLVVPEHPKILGYYTLSSFAVNIADLPEKITKKLPRYPVVPATLLGRLAISRDFQRKGLGDHLLLDALNRSYRMSQQIASYAVIVDAKDKQAKSFYTQYDFEGFPDHTFRLFLTMKKIALLFGK